MKTPIAISVLRVVLPGPPGAGKDAPAYWQEIQAFKKGGSIALPASNGIRLTGNSAGQPGEASFQPDRLYRKFAARYEICKTACCHIC